MTIAICGNGCEKIGWLSALMENESVKGKFLIYKDYAELADAIEIGEKFDFLLVELGNEDGEYASKLAQRIAICCPLCRIFYVIQHENSSIQAIPHRLECIAGFLFEDSAEELLTLTAQCALSSEDMNSQYIEVKNKSGTYHVKCNDVMFMEGQNHYVDLHLKENVIRTNKRLYSYEEELSKEFIRCHKGYIVNLNCVKHFSRQGIELTNGEVIPLGRTYYGEFRKLISDYFQEK